MDEKPKKLGRRFAWATALVLALSSIAAGAWWLRGRTIYTDGQSIQIAARDVKLREVLWTTPRPLEIDFGPPEQLYEPALSPDGTELYFVRGKPGRGAHIFVTYRRDNQWTKPVALPNVNAPTGDDLGPRVSPDGRLLYFYSDRPGGVGGYDLWAARREKSGWGKPYNLGPAINTEFNEMNPDSTPDGRRLIFSTNRKAASREQVQAWRGTIRQTGSGDYDLWIATIADTAPSPTFTNVSEIRGINTDYVEGASAMSPAGDFLYFASNRPGGAGKFDLYRARAVGDDFGPAENLGAGINTPENETDPALAMGGFRLYFSSDRANHEGLYTLLSSDSREVYAHRQNPGLPRLGWSVWSLLLSALLLIPLILALRASPGRLGTLQRCLVASLLIHALLTLVFSFVLVTRDVTRYVKRQIAGGGDVALNLNLPKDVEIGLAVRSQYSSDIPLNTAEPTSVSRTIANTPPERPTLPNGKSDAPLPAIAKSVNAAELPIPSKPLAPPSATPVKPEAIATATAIEVAAPPSNMAKVAQPTPALATSEAPPAQQRAPQPASAAEVEVPRFITIPGTIPVHPTTAPVTLASNINPARLVNNPAAAPAPATIADTSVSILSPSPPAPPDAKPIAVQSLAEPRAAESSAIISRQSTNASAPTTRPETALPTVVATVVPANSGSPIQALPSTPGSIPGLPPTPAANPDLPVATTPLDIPTPPTLATAARKPGPADAAPTPGEVTLASRRVVAAPPQVAPSAITVDPIALTPAAAPQLTSPKSQLNPAASAGIAAPTAQVDPTTLAAIPGPLGPGAISAPASPFPRSPEERQPRIEKQGGTKDSEAAVDRGLAYLARQQEPDGRWTLVLGDDDNDRPGRRPKSAHDMANTGLAMLAMLTRDNTPDKPSPYRNAVTKGLNYLVATQEENGDLRGPPHLRGAGSRAGDMYDHGIATLALAEAALMTRDKRYTAAAKRGAAFIVAAQDERSGGWRYVPGEYGDSSVFGWQIMALHACEQLGFETPAETRDLARRYLRGVSQGPRGMLAGYQPGRAATPTMTAEILYARMLLGQKITDDDVKAVTDFIARQPPDAREPNLYYWYYASLSMLQAQSDQWKRWNALTRDTVIALQQRGAGGRGVDGSWDADPRNAERGGRIYMTAIAVLTLEVYYRYLPLQR